MMQNETVVLHIEPLTMRALPEAAKAWRSLQEGERRQWRLMDLLAQQVVAKLDKVMTSGANDAS